MKKEFKAPVVEAKDFSCENVMAALNSGEKNDTAKWATFEDETSSGFNQWKGLK